MQAVLGLKAGDVVISYLGSLGGMYLIDEMLLFFKKYKERESRAKFLFITATNKEDILEKAKSLMIDQADIVIKNAARNEVPLLISLSQFSIFFIRDDYSKKASSPTKQGEIMAMGVPLICNDIGDTGKIIEESGAGLVVNDFSDFSIAKAAENSESFKGISRELIRNGAIKYYDLKEGADRYSKVYQKI
jgi:glycosyltransferase involved in cell wall biosynthesis